MDDLTITMSNDNEKEISQGVLDLQILLSQAIEKGVAADAMERLLAVWERLQAIRAKKEYNIAMALFQSRCPIIKKEKEVPDYDGKIRYRYAPLDDIIRQVKDLLFECGFSYVIKTKEDDKGIIVYIKSSHTGGHTETSKCRMPFTVNEKIKMSEQQKTGNALTYATRRAFCNAYGIITGDQDNDGNEPPPIEPVKDKQDNNKNQMECGELLKTIMGLLRERVDKIELFPGNDEKIKYGKQANAAANNKEVLVALLSELNIQANKRREEIKKTDILTGIIIEESDRYPENDMRRTD